MAPADKSITALLKREAAARSKDLVAAGMPRAEISRHVAAGKLVRVARGLYALPDRHGGEHQAVITVAKRVPGAVFCLLTALRIHELTTQAPFEVWIAVPNKAHSPRIDYPPLRIVRFSPESLASGVTTRKLDGTLVRLTSVAKTVADCFKFRNKIGLDVALEALRESVRERKATRDELWAQARVDRVANVMRPYLEALA